jgi:hypothetical protein
MSDNVTSALQHSISYLYVIVGGKLVESSSLNYMESDTMWIHPKCAPPPSHLYINNLYPPEYAELDQARLTGQHDTCYASTDLLEQHYNQVKQTRRWLILTESYILWRFTSISVDSVYLSQMYYCMRIVKKGLTPRLGTGMSLTFFLQCVDSKSHSVLTQYICRGA